MNLVQTFLRLAGEAAALLPGETELQPLDVDRDWPDLERLLLQEEWPFVRADIEVGHAQPGGASLVARRDGRFAGFFTTHAFDRVGYLDMMVIASDFRGKSVARPLYLEALRQLHRNGMRGLVVHSTNDSARLIRLMGFEAGQDFTLLQRAPGATATGPELLDDLDRSSILSLDAEVFGAPREAWVDALLTQPEVRFVGTPGGTATACLRPRIGNARCLDAVNSRTDPELRSLVDGIVAALGPAHELQCFARTDGALHHHLVSHGFIVPDFFVPIGPLVEWRQGDTGTVGTGARVQSLMWL